MIFKLLERLLPSHKTEIGALIITLIPVYNTVAPAMGWPILPPELVAALVGSGGVVTASGIRHAIDKAAVRHSAAIPVKGEEAALAHRSTLKAKIESIKGN